MGQVVINVLGAVELSLADDPAIEVPRSCHGFLTLMALHGGAPLRRSDAAFRLWPDTDEAKARHNLSTALWRLRSADPRLAALLPPDSHAVIQLASGTHLITDYRRFLDGFEAYRNIREPSPAQVATARQVAQLYRGDPFCDIEADWAEIERERLRSIYLDLLFKICRDSESCGEVGEAIRFGERLVMLDPYREDVHRLLMRLHMKSGNRAKAIAQYRHCEGEIGASLGVSPMPETIALYEDLIALPHRQRAPERPQRIDAYASAIRARAGDVMRLADRQKERLTELVDYVDRIDSLNANGAPAEQR